jgi:hypothetical protein
VGFKVHQHLWLFAHLLVEFYFHVVQSSLVVFFHRNILGRIATNKKSKSQIHAFEHCEGAVSKKEHSMGNLLLHDLSIRDFSDSYVLLLCYVTQTDF